MESLEKRELMASDFTNPFLPADVDRDQRVTALDALTVINRLNRDGVTSLTGMQGNKDGTESVDVDGDNFLSPLDALSVINVINSGREEGEHGPLAGVRYRFFRANPDGTPGAELNNDVISGNGQLDIEVNVGDRVIVRTEVIDRRHPGSATQPPTGVFAGYHDINLANSDGSSQERLRFQWGEFNQLTFDSRVNGGSLTLRYDTPSGEIRRAVITPALNSSGTAISTLNTIPRIKTALEGIFGAGNVGVFAADLVNPSRPDFRISFTGNASRQDIFPEGVIEQDNLTTRNNEVVPNKAVLLTQASPNPTTDKRVTRAGLNHSIDNGRFDNGTGPTDNPRFVSGQEGVLLVNPSGLFTADPSNERISFATAGLVTGTRVRLTTTGTLPGGLAPATDYFVIQVTNTTASLATSLANALSGTAVDITSVGAGVHTATLSSSVLRGVGGFVNVTNPQPEEVATSYLGVVDAIFKADAAGLVNLAGTISPLGSVEGEAVSTGIALLGAQNRYLVAAEVELPKASINIVDQLSARPSSFAVNEDSGQSTQNLSSNWTDRTTATARGIVSVTQPVGGTVTFDPNGSEVRFTPNLDFNGQAVFTYVLRNNLQPNPIETTGTVTFTVAAVNDAPNIIGTSFSVAEDLGPLAILPSSIFSPGPSDESSQTVSFATGAIVQGPTATQGTAIINSSGALEFSPATDFFGSVVIQIRGTDNGLAPANQSTVATITINVTPVNDPPVVLSSQFSMQEDGTLAVSANQIFAPGPANESSQTVTLTLTQPVPAGVSINAAGAIVITPPSNSFAPITFGVMGTDNGTNPDNLTASTITTITVTPVNDGPDAVNDNLAVIGINAPQPLDLMGNVSGKDSPGPGEELIDTIRITPATGDLIPRDTLNGNVVGTLTLGTNGSNVIYTPPGDVFDRTISFTYTITDGGGLKDTATVNVYIAPPARPYALDDSFSIPEDAQARQFNVLQNDFGNDTNGNNFPKNLESISSIPASQGTLSFDPATDLVSFQPASNFFGPVVFTYVMSSGTPEQGSRTQATVSIQVTEINDPPVAANRTASTDEDVPLTILASAITDGLSRGPGEDAQTLTISVTPIASTLGTVVVNSSGNVVFTPFKDFFGSVDIVYNVTDNGTTNGVAAPLSSILPATIQVTVNAINDSPIANSDAFTTAEDTTRTISIGSITTNDRPGPDNETSQGISFVPITGTIPTTAGGTVSQVGNDLIYMPSANFNGTDSFTYEIQDGPGLKTTGTVTLTVTEVNDAPIPTAVTRSMFASVPTTFDLTSDLAAMPKGPAKALDERGQTLRIVPGSQVVNTTPNGNVTATLNANGTVTFFAPLNTSGRQTFSYQIEDNGTTNGQLDRKGAVGIFHVDVLPFIPSDFRGVVYVDDNLNGVPDTNELRIAGADVTLTIPADPSTPGSKPTQRKAVTDTAGTYYFDLLPPGAYTVSYAIPMLTDDRPDHLIGGANALSRTIVAPGDAHVEVNFAIQGIKSSQISVLDNISWNYMIGNGRTDLIPKGLYAAVGADGKSEWTMARDTFKSDSFHELVLSDDGTRAYLTALRGDELFTATLNRGQFFAVPDSAGNKLVRVLASKEELTWQRVNMAAPPVSIVSRRYLDAVDEYFASEG
ncbi:MAG: tandem-95 repeat protein [Pirellula sp.]